MSRRRRCRRCRLAGIPSPPCTCGAPRGRPCPVRRLSASCQRLVNARHHLSSSANARQRPQNVPTAADARSESIKGKCTTAHGVSRILNGMNQPGEGKKGTDPERGKRPGRSAQSLFVNRGWRRGSLQSTVFFPRMFCRGLSIRTRALG
jgi:hypothetical protein